MTHPISFTKMHGLGNDFVVINALSQQISLTTERIQQLSNRHTGIGFDQLLLLETAHGTDFFCRIYNADGSQAEQCGNGLRCLAKFIYDEKLHPETHFAIGTIAGIFPVIIHNDNEITVTLSPPTILEKLTTLNFQDASLPLSILTTGNPHAILKVTEVATIPIEQLGPKIAAHNYFKAGANVGFMEVINKHHVKLRTFERGAGETHACGSNACAAAVSGILNDWLEKRVEVEFRYGKLLIEWEGAGEPIRMSGPAVTVFTGVILN